MRTGHATPPARGGSSWFVRVAGRLGAGRRLPFSLALVGVILGLTAMAGAVLGTLAWREKRELSRQLLEEAMGRTARLAAAHAEAFLHGAESAVRLGPELVAQGLLDPARDEHLERFTLGVLRAHPQVAWVSYGGRDDRFVGAWRDQEGRTYVNRSWPVGERIRLEEDRVWPDGRREPVRRSDDHRYRPRERPYFQLGERQRAVAWTEPYEFYAGGGLGLSCVAPLLGPGGTVRGVFTVDLSLGGLGEFLDGLRVSPRGRVVVVTHDGALVAAPRGKAPGLALTRSATEGMMAVEEGGERLLVRSVPLAGGERPWRVLVTVPERDYAEPVDAVARRAALLGLVGLALVAAAGVAAVRRLARPLRQLAARAGKLGWARRRTAAIAGPRDEIEALSRTLHHATRAARDRALAKRLLGRYVSRELADGWLSQRHGVRLAGEAREVVVLMSDLRGFSALSEQLGPEAVFRILNRYLERMTAIIVAHGGSINAFLGDGILVLFGAPTRRADDAVRAVRCAWAMQAELAALNREGRAEGLPELGMGIGLHAGAVMAGSIGGRDRTAYTVVGPVVNRTARIVDLAVGGEVLVSDAVLARARDVARVGAPRQAQVKGVPAPMTLYPLLDVGALGEPDPAGPEALGRAASDPLGARPALSA